MKIENQVCSLAQAIALQQKGIIQDSLFYHLELPETVYRKESMVIADKRFLESATHKGHYFSAFNVAELGVMLPNELDLSNGNYFFTKKGLLHTYEEVTGVILKEWQGTELEAIRRAEILIDLLENNLTTPEEVNTRLIQS
jgi:hypothetical protein